MWSGNQGGVTPIDSIVTTATAVGQQSMVKAIQKGAVNGQSAFRITQSAVKVRSETRRNGKSGRGYA